MIDDTLQPGTLVAIPCATAGRFAVHIVPVVYPGGTLHDLSGCWCAFRTEPETDKRFPLVVHEERAQA